MKTKVCTKCRKEKELTEFYKDKYNKIGLQYWCKECHDKYRNDHYRRNREWVNNYKLQRGCQTCGYNKCPEALVLHHTNSKEKEFSISAKLRLSKQRILREIEKCIVLCKNCHAELHWGER